MKKSILFFCLFLFAGYVRAENAWWVDATFEAVDSQVLGIPVKEIDPSFEKASLLNAETMIKKYPEAKKDLARNKAFFKLEKNRSRKLQKIVVGVYKGAKDGGEFLLVVEKYRDKWKPVFVHKVTGTMGFSALYDGNPVIWGFCMECDNTAVLNWSSKAGYSVDTSPEVE